ncbi:hypothetical protein ACOSQ4_021332 [Xanthoceras sorbifolium]
MVIQRPNVRGSKTALRNPISCNGGSSNSKCAIEIEGIAKIEGKDEGLFQGALHGKEKKDGYDGEGAGSKGREGDGVSLSNYDVNSVENVRNGEVAALNDGEVASGDGGGHNGDHYIITGVIKEDSSPNLNGAVEGNILNDFNYFPLLE